MAIVIEIDHERDVAHIKWTDNGQMDIMPMKWLRNYNLQSRRPSNGEKLSMETLGIISEVKGKIQGANHDWNRFYFMVIPMGAKYPVPVWNKELELVRKAQ